MSLGDFSSLVSGNKSSYGIYTLEGKPKPGRKHKGTARTVAAKDQPLTQHLYEQHLKGQQGLGIVPIDEKSMCRFGAVDIDVYDGLDHEQINAIIVEKNLPLVPTRSKSG